MKNPKEIIQNKLLIQMTLLHTTSHWHEIQSLTPPPSSVWLNALLIPREGDKHRKLALSAIKHTSFHNISNDCKKTI